MKEINKEHPEYRAWRHAWTRYRDLYAGGDALVRKADRYLIPRQREPLDVYSERVSRAFYENYIGSIIDWYAATLFRREPVLTYAGTDGSAREFFNALAMDCDLRGSTLSDFYRRQVVEALVTGRSYVIVDFPRAAAKAGSRAEEERLGVSRGYISEFPVESVINWRRNEQGEFDWVVLRAERLLSDSPDSTDWRVERVWTYYDRERFVRYIQAESEGKQGPIQILDEGAHGLAKLRRTPVFEFSFGEGMWLMNRAASLQLEHFNKSNALSWALTMGLFAMPVIYSDRDWTQTVGESYYLQLGKDDRFGWTEPEGHVYRIALENLDRLKEEIYRVCYLTHQAGGSKSQNSQMTGLSKQRDYLITQEVLRVFGDKVKDHLRQVLNTLAEAREDRLEVDVAGLDEFDIGEFSGELEDAERLLRLGIQSKTLARQVHKKLALKYLCDANQQTKDQIAREIDSAE